ncbi:MAG: right-handed parallel beta-helix repeat-containing protein, partial [Pseudomonadota bacterium]|nr:right-handed parallel beta-helix repeat-containing protein [Pseudomonadota bacterium]
TVTGGRAVGAASSPSAGGNGGAVYVAGGLLTLANTTISGNSAARSGGGIYAHEGAVNVSTGTISGNSARLTGGVSGFDNDIRITNSIISGNTGGGVGGTYGDLQVIYSTVSNNTGDGIDYGGGNVSVTNSTISGNTRGIVVTGGDFALDLELTHSTVTRNAQTGVLAYSAGEGIEIILNRSLIAGNSRSEISADAEYTLVTAGNSNVLGHSGDARITGFNPGSTDIVPRQPLNAILNPTLADNGGFTRTHALVAGSPAIDAVNDGTCPPPTRDQRGITRPRDGNGDGGPACDAGAVEYVASPGIPPASALP